MHKWERVCKGAHPGDGQSTEFVSRLQVPGGWIYRIITVSGEDRAVNAVYVPDLSSSEDELLRGGGFELVRREDA
jgi:hypothetical protein